MTAPSLFAAHQRASAADDLLRELSAVPTAGLICHPVPSVRVVGQEDSTFTPLAGPPLQLGGRIGMPVQPQSLFTVQGGIATVHPLFIVWPYSVPTLDGTSLFERPSISVYDGLRVYLSVTFRSPKPGILNSSDAKFFTSRAADLTTGLKLDGNPTIQLIGSFTKNETTGQLQFGYASGLSELPYIPS